MVATIERMMAAVAEDDRGCLNDVLTEDFYAFENGVPVSGRELLDLMSRNFSKGKRYRWSVTLPQIEVQGDFGAIVYVNVRSIVETPGAEPAPHS